MAELPVNNQPSTNEFEDDDDLFVSAIGVSCVLIYFLENSNFNN